MKQPYSTIGIAVLSVLGLFVTAPKASAASFGPCPSSTLASTSAAYTANGGLCNVVITFNADGSISTVISNPSPYDGAEDTLVGVINNTASAITSFTLTGSGASPDLFGFDGDGACSGQYVALVPCGAFRPSTPSGANDYAGPGVSFSGINLATTSGTVTLPPASPRWAVRPFSA